jgi:hypothetical protein
LIAQGSCAGFEEGTKAGTGAREAAIGAPPGEP